MDIIQSLALVVLLSMIVYLVIVNLIKDNAVKTPGTISTFVPVKAPSGPAAPTEVGPSPLPLELKKPEKPEPAQLVSNRLPAVLASPADAAVHKGSSIFNPDATGTLPQNHDIYEKQADFGSDVTNINQFYRNNPEVFSKILGSNQVTNIADWEQRSKDMAQAALSKSAGPIQAANFEDLNFSTI